MEQKKKSAAGEAESQDTAEVKKSGKLLWIIMVVAVLLLAGGCMVFSENIQALWGRYFGIVLADGESRYLHPISEFTVNLADAGGRRYLRIRLQLGFDDRDLQHELERREHEIRSELIILLRSKRAEDLLQERAAEELQDEILKMLNRMLQSGAVKSIYYDDFIIQ